MGIKLDISVATPLSDDDRDILAGTSVMVLAIANRQNLAELPEEPEPCGTMNDEGYVCVREDGHSGRPKYRPITFDGPLN